MLVGGSLACAGLPGESGLAPIRGEEVPIAFAAPEMVVVKPGDTLQELADRHRVTVANLKSWNGLESDAIEVDQVLLVWVPPPAPARVVAAGSAPAGAPPGSLAGVLADPAPPPGGVPGDAAAPGVVPGAPVDGDGLADAGGAADAEAVPGAPTTRVAIERPALASLFGLQIGGSDADLAEAASGMERHDAAESTNGLGDRTIGAGSSAEELVVAKPEMRDLGPKIPNTPVATPRLPRPPPKSCLRGPSATIGEDGAVTSAGLSVGQINAGMGQISRYTVRCFPSGTEGSYGVIVEVTVGCNGTVSNVFLVDAGVVPARVTSCIQQTLGYASFAAHAVPNGVTFQYPMKFTF